MLAKVINTHSAQHSTCCTFSGKRCQKGSNGEKGGGQTDGTKRETVCSIPLSSNMGDHNCSYIRVKVSESDHKSE